MKNTTIALLVLGSLIITGCGGQYSSAEGLWTGTSNTGRTVNALILSDGSYWVMYSTVNSATANSSAATNNAAVMGGAMQGILTETSGTVVGTFTSADGVDFNQEGQGISAFTMTGSYSTKNTLSGQVSYTANSQQVTFQATYNKDYDTKPSLATIAATYTGTAGSVAAGSSSGTLTISASGAITGSDNSGCQFTGAVTPHASGNVYNMTITFGGGSCASGTSTDTGIAYYNAAQKNLIGVTLNTARTDSFIFSGTRP